MDMVTGAQVAVTLIVPAPRERMWDLVTAVDRIGEWRPGPRLRPEHDQCDPPAQCPTDRPVADRSGLRDAELLCRKLIEVDRGRAELIEALHDFERQMRGYGFAAGKQSLRNAKQAASTNRVARSAGRTAFRTINAIPPLRRKFAAQLGT